MASSNLKDAAANPFVVGPHSHPAFNPQRLGSKGFAVRIIFKIINQIISLIPSGQAGQKDIIGDIIEALINNLVNKVKTAIAQLQQLVVDTVNALVNLAEQVSR